MDASALNVATPDIIGTVPQWITAISSTTLAGALVTLIVQWWRRGVSLKGLENANEADIRDHYAEEVAALRGQLLSIEKHYREMLEQSDRRHAECEASRGVMREELEGLKKQFRAASADRVLRMEENPPEAPHSRAAAERVKKITEGK